MPYSIKNNHPDCTGWAVVKTATNELMGCHKTEAQAKDQLTAINISEYGDRKLEDEKIRLKTAQQILNNLKKQI